MSISQNFPNTRPSLSINFARSQTLDPRITFTRTTSGTRVGPDGYIEVIPADQPRFDFDPVTGESLGLLIEESRTNLITTSEDLSSGNWGTNANGTGTVPQITTNYGIAPDGTQTADRVIFDRGSGTTTNDSSTLFNNGYSTTGSSYTQTVWLKTTDGSTKTLRYSFSGLIVEYITVTGTWTRFTRTLTSFYDNNRHFRLALRFSGSSQTADVLVWGAQVEQGSFPTSYIPTEGSEKTRTADSASITGSNFTEWHNPSEGTVYVKYSIKGLGTNSTGFNRIFEIFDSESLNRLTALLLTNAQIYESFTIGTQQMDYRPFTINFNEFNEYVIGFGTESQRYAYNASGVLSGNTDNSIGISTFYPNQLNIGFQFDNTTRYLNGYISQFTYYPVRLSNSQLQNLILR